MSDMSKPRIIGAYVSFDRPEYGDFTLQHEVVTGRPKPTDAQAWAFSLGLEILEKFMFMSEEEQFALLQHLGLK